MKNFLTLFLVLIMLCIFALPVFAEDELPIEPPVEISSGSKVSFTLSNSYVVVIPSNTLAVDAERTMKITANKMSIGDNSEVQVVITEGVTTAGQAILTMTKNTAQVIYSPILMNNTQIDPSKPVARFSGNNTTPIEQTGTLKIQKPAVPAGSSVIAAGEYKGQLTFVVKSVAAVPQKNQ